MSRRKENFGRIRDIQINTIDHESAIKNRLFYRFAS